METGANHQFSDSRETKGAPDLPFESLSHVKNDLNDVIAALALLGVNRCSQCSQFFRSSGPGTLFDCGKFVCYECIPTWWPALSAQIEGEERDKLEGKLSSWLRKYHGAGVVKEVVGKVLETNESEFHMKVKCLECRGSGKLMEGTRCRFCSGAGKVWIVTSR
jgi:hypothetical protein